MEGTTSHCFELLFCKCVYYFKNKEFKGNNFSKAFAFLNFSCISSIFGLPQGFDQQNCSSVNSTKELPRLLGFVNFAKFPHGLSRLVNEWNIRIHSKNFSDNYFAITSGKFERKTHNKHSKANMRQAII